MRVCGAIMCSIWDFDCFDYVVCVLIMLCGLLYLLILRNET